MINCMSRRFLLLHGWGNRRPPSHWQWWLAQELRARGEQVLYPQLPDTDAPSLAAWTELLDAELAQLGDGERVVISHSLGCALWLSAAGHVAPVDRVALVAPPSPTVLSPYSEVEEFVRHRPDPDAVARAAGSTRLVCSDDDEYCPEGAPAMLADLRLDIDLIHGGGHLNPDAGYGPWPSMLDWCLDPTTRIVGRPDAG
jgi:uncharacterized protein